MIVTPIKMTGTKRIGIRMTKIDTEIAIDTTIKKTKGTSMTERRNIGIETINTPEMTSIKNLNTGMKKRWTVDRKIDEGEVVICPKCTILNYVFFISNIYFSSNCS